MSRTISPSALSPHSAHIWGGSEGSGAHCGPLVDRRDSGLGGFRAVCAFPAYRRGAPGAGRRCAFYACDASIYRCDAGRCPIPQRETRGRGFSRRRAGASRHGAWPHCKLRNAGRASESTGAAQDGGCAATPSIAVRFASTHSDGHLLLLVLDLMLLGRCSVDGPSLALGSHARLS